MGLSSQYMFNGLLINPGYAGAKDHGVVSANYRNQWAGFEGAPTNQTISGHVPMKKQPMAFGMIIRRETIGVSRDFGVQGVASYKLEMRRADLRIGLGAGFQSRRSNWSTVVLDQQDDELFAANGDNMIRPEFSFGGYYQEKEWYVGYSIPTLLGYRYETSDAMKVKFSFGEMNHMLTAGFKYDINRQLVLKPSFLLRSIPTGSTQIDLNTNLIINDRFWTGLSYRMGESITGLFECQLNDKLRVGYSYDHPISQVGQFSIGSHELMLMYEFRLSSFAKNPRYF